MSVDLSQFHQVFFEESIEGLDLMESTLMELDSENIDGEMINTIFRCAHSIKGGSATFGFTAIAEFTHVLETLLDEIRDGKRGIDVENINLFLESVDCLRDLLSSIDNGQSTPNETSVYLQKRFEKILDTGNSSLSSSASGTSSENTSANNNQDNSPKTWDIKFAPSVEVLKAGNEPIRIFRALAELGELKVKAVCRELPILAAMDPELVYLSWELTLVTDRGIEEIEEQFEWVADESDISIAEFKTPTTWSIKFRPFEGLIRSGNEPLRIIRHLKEVCETCRVLAHTESVPKLKVMDSESCYVWWEIEVSGDFSRRDIEEVFEWVVDDADIDICENASSQSGDEAPRLESENERERGGEVAVETSLDKGAAKSTPSVETSRSDLSTKPITVKKSTNTESTSIRVGIDKVDSLINMVGELVITQSMLGQLGNEFNEKDIPKLLEGLGQLEHNTRELQESVMRIRMLPISFAFSRFPRMVRDLGQQLGKKINLEMIGEQTELDKTVMEKIGDPLVHLVRNSIDHGIEQPEERSASGKSETGQITLNAYHAGGNVVIEIKDDGKGLDREIIAKKGVERGLISEIEASSFNDEQIFDLIFQPGFSTAAVVSDVSGRGVGMDVVRRNIQALNGVVEIRSKRGEGSTITIRLPLTLAILDGQLVRIGKDVYVFPLVSIVESIQCNSNMVSHIGGGCSVFKLRDEYIPIVSLDRVFSCSDTNQDMDQSLMVVVESEREKVGLIVDELLAQQQVVIKSLEKNYKRVEGISGATILGDGKVALIIDIIGVVKLAGADKMKHIIENNTSQQTQISDEYRRVGNL